MTGPFRAAPDRAILECMDTTRTSPTTSQAALLPDGLRLGAVHLSVSDLDRSAAFYERSLGLVTRGREGDEARLGTGVQDLVVLHERPGARPALRSAGLFHFALLHPSRLELARAVVRLAVTRTPVDGASDHGVSEAIYLPDPDGNGIELYADRPREAWPAPGAGERVGMFTRALDIPDLLAAAGDEEPRARSSDGLVMGHMHLHVGDVEQAVAFYRDLVGFEWMTGMPSAAFLSAGGYHHHLAVNTWRGRGIAPAPLDALGLRRWTILLPQADDVAGARGRLDTAGVETEDADGGFLLRDPWGIAALVTTG